MLEGIQLHSNIHLVYILFSKSLDKFIGYTSGTMDLRLRRHLTNHHGFTAKAKDWTVVYTELHKDKISALKREKEIKNWKSRIKIEYLINDC